MKKRVFVSLIIAAFTVLPESGYPQAGRLLHSRDTPLRWVYMNRILSGEGIPTTVQTISVSEAAFYGIDSGHHVSIKPTINGRVSIKPFVIWWNGLDFSRRMTDSTILDRFRLDYPALLFGLSFGSDLFYGTMEMDFGTDSLACYAEGEGLAGIWEPKEYLSYWIFPQDAYFAWSGRNVTLAAGRFATGIGLGDVNILLNGQARWYDQIQFSWWSERLRFFSLWGSSSSHLNEAEYIVQSYSAKEGTAWGWDRTDNHDAATQSMVPFKMFTYHRIEFKPTARIGLGLSEMQLVGGTAPKLENLLPAGVWHNVYTAGVSNVMLHTDFWLLPLKGLLLYGEFLLDDGKAPEEPSDTKPTSRAWEVGATLAFPVGFAAWRFSLCTEFSHVDEWTYNRWQPYLTMYQRQLITGGSRGFDIPLGHPEGGDVDQVGVRLSALTRKGNRIDVGYSYILKGPVYLGMIEKNESTEGPAYIPVYYDYDAIVRRDRALTALLGNTRKGTHAFSLDVSWPLTPRCEFEGGIDIRYVQNAGHISGRTSIERVWNLGCKWSWGE